MTEKPDSVPPAKDPRPRPQYGELAPEGWTWQPPQDEDRASPAPSPTAGAGAGTPPLRNHPAFPSTPPPSRRTGQRTAPGWDRPLTIGLLTFGLLVTLYGAFSLGALPDAMQLIYTQQNLGTYTPAAGIGTLTTAGAILVVFVWLATTAVSVRLLLQHRRAFYVPIIGGAVSIVALFAFMLAAMLNDPTLIEFLSRQ
ncbi:DUF6264 family protein [Cryobacterium luteum]|uniref:Uncharacterized protein n=1 Tax=Cryobacterium luteum TaxID=1424661 RepID=A0A1H8DVN3_9MICO|nr:DUF6264 family protein [Cryobacterium luteum]TFB89731.1 hypothetical protein E3O10_07975 [Cryobacterium luteum]SEN10914.1 hypothetical protein SAMN05216281_10436 [Cryobacterium luteum]